MPKVSVIMPVYNAEKYIEIAINSILNQTLKDFELIIVDDKGNDKSIEIVQNYHDPRIKIIHNDSNQGIAYSRNRGISIATGKYIALMDDDDYTPRNRLEIENDFLDEHNNIDVVGGAVCTIDEKNKILRGVTARIHNPKRVRAELIFHDIVANGSAMFRKQFVIDNEIKYWDNMQGMEDYHFWVQCSLKGSITNLDDVFLYWRQTDGNETYKRIHKEKPKRIDTFKKIQEYALKNNGFVLTNEEINCFTRQFQEGGKYQSGQIELEKLFDILTKIVLQGQKLNFSKELEYVCRHMFGQRVANSTIWF